MEKTIGEAKSPFAVEPVGRLLVKFAVPCVISLLVNSLYNIVDQIFIGWGVGYLGNGATNVVFPITIIALALSLMIGDGGAAYLSLKLGEGDLASAKRGVGNAIAMVTVVSVALAAVFLTFIFSVVYLPRFKTLRLDAEVFRPSGKTCKSILTFGISSFITQFAICTSAGSLIKYRRKISPQAIYADRRARKMKNRVITISREFGSGGRAIGKKVAEALGIACYDGELLQKIALESGLDENYIKDAGEYAPGETMVLPPRTAGFARGRGPHPPVYA